MLNILLFLISSMMVLADQKQTVTVELTKHSDDSYLVNVIQVDDEPYKRGDKKHHYAVDPDVKVYATPDQPSECPEDMPHFTFPLDKSILSSNKFGYNSKNKRLVKFDLSCEEPCKSDEVCTVFGCQLTSIKDHVKDEL
jgi:hypothetical protein